MSLVQTCENACNLFQGLTAKSEFRSCDSLTINLLELNGNTADDWSRVFFHIDALLNDKTIKRIHRCTFNTNSIGYVVIHSLEGDVSINNITMPCGLRDTNFCNSCWISPNCLILSNTIISNVYISEASVITNCGTISGPQNGKTTSFGNGEIITVGPENGGRDIVVNADSEWYDICCRVYKFHPESTSSNNKVVSSPFTIICTNSVIMNCANVTECFIGESCHVTSSILQKSTLLSNGQKNSIQINNIQLSYGLINKGCSLENNCQVEHIYMAEYSSIGVNARVCHSILAPDSSVAGGECHHSVVGPFIGFHHHSLLIASIWPLGRGNIAYGAKVGQYKKS